MAKAAKKVDPKVVAKLEVMAIVKDALTNAGMTVLDGEKFGMTKGTVVVRHGTADIQIKPIAPKAGETRYTEAEEE